MSKAAVIEFLRDLAAGKVPAVLPPGLDGEESRAAFRQAALLLQGEQHDADFWLLSEIVEHIPEMVFVKDAENLRFVRVNEAAEKLLGINREELLGKTDFDFFPHQEASFFVSKDREVLKQGRLLDIPQEEILTRSGTRYLHTKKIPITDAQGKPCFLVGLSRDITAIKAAQDELARSQKELRRLSSQLQQAQEEERLRLARELHDELGQVLTGLKIELAWIDEHIPQGDLALLERLDATQKLADLALAIVRRVATALRPQILDDLGLRAALDWLAQEMCERARLEPNLEFNLLHQVDKEMAITIFRICQDALTNVLRQASAHHVWISLSESGNSIQLDITDDGVNVDHPTDQERRVLAGLSLVGIRERAHLRGGSVQLGTDPQRGGTRLTVSLPSVWN